MDPVEIALVVVAACALVVLATGLRVIADYQRGVVLRLGCRGPLLDPGLRFIVPLGVDRLIRVDLRSSLLEIPIHEVFTRDGVPVRVGASVHLQVLNPLLAVTRVIDYRRSTSQLVQAALREVVGHTGLRELLVEAQTLREELARVVDARTEPWGIRITSVDVREVELPDPMRRAMERQAEILGRQQSERVQADAELATARRLAAAAEILATQPYAVQLRFIQALTEMSNDRSTVVVVPLPAELMQPFFDLHGRGGEQRRPGDGGSGASGERPDAGSGQPL